MPNPFDDDSRDFLALCNAEVQYSLWPQDIAVPEGWRAVYGPAARDEVIGYIDRTWTDMRPKSLRDAMARGDGLPA
jgi:MbtH protein